MLCFFSCFLSLLSLTLLSLLSLFFLSNSSLSLSLTHTLTLLFLLSSLSSSSLSLSLPSKNSLQLLRLVQGSNVRLKIQRNRERRENEKKRRAQKLQDEKDNIIELARSTAMDAEAEWLRQREEATRVRQEEEDAQVSRVVQKEIADATAFLDSTEGKREYKKRAGEIQKRRQEAAIARGEPKPKRLPSKQANALAKQEITGERAEEARKQAVRDFRRKNTSNFEKRETKAMEVAKKNAARRKIKILSELEQRLKDDIDMTTGLCSEPELNLNKFCVNYTGW